MRFGQRVTLPLANLWLKTDFMMHGASEFRHSGTDWHEESLARLTPRQSMPAEVKDNCVDDFCTSEASVLMRVFS